MADVVELDADDLAVVEAAPEDDPAAPRYAAAAQALERAVGAGCQDPNVLYLLALAHKRQGKTAEARAALRKIPKPDADVVLQMGLLSLRENQLAQAEGEFARALEADPGSYEACYNLLLTRLTLGQVEACAALIPQALDLAGRAAAGPAGEGERRFLLILQALLRACRLPDGILPDISLTGITAEDEARLLQVVRSLGQVDTAYALLKALAEARPSSAAVREAHVEAGLVKAKGLMDRCAWTEADVLLHALQRERGAGRAAQAALLNMLGCCAALTHDFEGGVRQFTAALKLLPNDARLHQNLALAHELSGNLAEADPHWNRYFDLLGSHTPGPPDVPDYVTTLAFEGLGRMASRHAEKERWPSALGYAQRAQRLRPDNPEVLERLFHLYNQAKRPQDARRTLGDLRRLRPDDPQLDLYELDLVEVKGLNDIERLLTDIERVLRRHPGDARVEERAVTMVGNVIPLMGNLCDQLTDQMGKVIDQVRHLPNYQINWSAVREVMRDLLKEFQKLRRITGKCLPLVRSDEHRRIVRDLAEHIDKKMEACRSMMG
jgi:tetratricopeptide (TPR) repeat protein